MNLHLNNCVFCVHTLVPPPNGAEVLHTFSRSFLRCVRYGTVRCGTLRCVALRCVLLEVELALRCDTIRTLA